MTVSIVGAGMAGLLAGKMFQTMNIDPIIYEKQNELPNNHSAVLRFRSSIVGDVLGIPFKKVTMVKSSVHWRNPIADALAYTNKCTNILRSDRSLPVEPATEERYIAPADLISRMAEGLNFKFGQDITREGLLLNGKLQAATPVISTMPMPTLMKLLEYEIPPEVKFVYTPGMNIRATISDCDAYVSLYIPDPSVSFSRISISGNQMIVEIQDRDFEEIPREHQLAPHILCDYAMMAAHYLGIKQERLSNIIGSKQKYAKILPIDDDARKDFIFWATDKYNIYALGRFATWRPKLLLDDLVNDVRKISSWMSRSGRYEAARAR